MKKVMDDMNELEATSFAQEARAQTLHEQVLSLEVSIISSWLVVVMELCPTGF
jgi:hypothetical protein